MRDVFTALSSPVRREILALLRERALTAGEIADRIPLAKPTLSGHFNVLKQAGLVSADRQGSTITYRINTSVVEDALAALLRLTRRETE
ncbi:MAG: autorepressor SdpR family transcription factor [Steroidobacteraceae bacterium]|jgi:DNA-binding transcriptional ArsR family regulator